MDNKKKTVFQLDTPFSTAQWPTIGAEDQETILELLCSLLEPLGNHRRKYLQPSKGKTRNARKRKRAQKVPGATDGTSAATESQAKPYVPSTPDVSGFIDVGLACVTRNLQEMSVPAPPPQQPGDGSTPPRDARDKETKTGTEEDQNPTEATKETPSSQGQQQQQQQREDKLAAYHTIFVARSGQSKPFQNHFPQMVAAAAAAAAQHHPVRLVGFSARHVPDRLSAALGIPRVSVVALRADSPLLPNLKVLADMVDDKVAPVVAPWLGGGVGPAAGSGFRETRIRAVETVRGPPRQDRTKTAA